MTAAVTFDFHNTLVRCDRWFDLEVRSLPAHVRSVLNDGADLPGIEALTDAYRGLRKEIMAHGREMDAVQGVQETFRRAGTSIDRSRIRPIIDDVMTLAAEEAELMPGVRPTLAHLRAHDVPLGIVSSAVHHEFLEWALARLGIAREFAVVVSSARAGYYKSRPEIYDIALESLGATAERSVHVGDSYRFDHLIGRQLGLATVWINLTEDDRSHEFVAPDLELTSLEGAGPALLELVRRRQVLCRAD